MGPNVFISKIGYFLEKKAMRKKHKQINKLNRIKKDNMFCMNFFNYLFTSKILLFL
jgi:hypothetical protein